MINISPRVAQVVFVSDAFYSGTRHRLTAISRYLPHPNLARSVNTKMSAASNDAEPFVLLAVAVSLILLRTYVRFHLVGLRQLKLDDYLMLFTGVRRYNL